MIRNRQGIVAAVTAALTLGAIALTVGAAQAGPSHHHRHHMSAAARRAAARRAAYLARHRHHH